jgi:hypothetical protein
MAMVSFLSKTNRVIDVPDWDTNLIRIFTLQKLPVLTAPQAEGYRQSEKEFVKKREEVGFTFYPPYETLLTLIEKAEPSGIFDEEELELVARTLPGYENIDTEDCIGCFLYMQKRKEWLLGNVHNN